MRLHPSIRCASQRLNSIRFSAKGAVQLLTTLLVFSLCLFPNIATAASPHIYDVPQAGPPGSQTQTVGNGFDPNATLDIYFDSTDVGLVVTDNNGSFGMALKAPTIRQNGLTIQIPKDAVPGQHWITAIERITELQSQVAFTVSVDWPQFGFNAQHTGFNPYENVLGPETVASLTIRWKYTTGHDIYASPVVANGIVYIGGNVGDDNNLYALEADTGAVLWKFPAAPFAEAPAVVNGVVYVSSYYPSNYLYALNANSGAMLWRYPAGGGRSPVVVNGVVYVDSQDHYVYAVNASTGKLLWKFATGSEVQSSPAVANGVVYVGAPDGNLYALDAGTGALLWKFATPSDSGFHTPVVVNGVVYAGSEDNNLYAVNASTGVLIWKYGGVSPYFQAVANGVVYFSSGNFYALDAATGALLWEYTADNDLGIAVGAANGVVYANSEYDGIVYAFDASTGALLWKYSTGNQVWSSPAVVNGILYFGCNDGNVYAFGLPNQQMAEKFSPPERTDGARLTPDWSLQPSSQVTPPLKK